MKILLLSDDFPPFGQGGAAAVAFNVAKGLLKKGHQVSVVTAVREEKNAGESVYEGIKIFAFQSSYHERWRAYLSLYNPKAVDFVRSILEKEKFDIVHAHNIHQYISYDSLRVTKKTGAKVILTAHDCMLVNYGKVDGQADYKMNPLQQFLSFRLRYNPFRNIIIKHYLKYVDNVAAVSNELKKLLEVNGIKKVEVVHNGVDLNVWKNSGQTNTNPTVLFSGKLTQAKGGAELTRALLEVSKEIKNLTLLIVGQKDSYTESLIASAQGLFNVVITGWTEEKNLPAIYSKAHLAVFPSTCFDTFGMVNIEAMALEKPVIATSFGGAKEIIVDGETGFIINPYDTENFSNKMIELLENPDKAKEMRKKGREKVEQFFTLEKQIEGYEELYK